MRFGFVNHGTHLLHLLLGKINVTRSEVLLESMRLGRAGNGNHALRSDPSKCNLPCRAALTLSERLDLVHYCKILVEVLALEFGHGAAEIVGRKIVGRLEVEIVNEPALS